MRELSWSGLLRAANELFASFLIQFIDYPLPTELAESSALRWITYRSINVDGSNWLLIGLVMWASALNMRLCHV